MGQENQAKHRQKSRDLKRRSAKQAPYERILIVCEGEKTEPNYLQEIKNEKRLASANVQMWPSEFGTEPIQVVNYAEHLFCDGSRPKSIERHAFDRVIAVFDRDDHISYHSALSKIRSLNNKLVNDNDEPVPFQAIASVPCFELWLLLHFEDVHAPIHRNDVYQRLKTYLPNYEKGQGGHWAATKHNLEIAVNRAKTRAIETNADNGNEPYTAIHDLVLLLVHLKD